MASDAQGFFRGKRLVVFGAGYVGEAVVLEALTREMEVIALTRNAEKAAVLRAAGARVVVGDLASEAWHEEISEGAEFVLDCVSSGGGGLEGYRRSYLEGMRSIIKWAQGVAERSRAKAAAVYSPGGDAAASDAFPWSAGVGTMVYTSSTSVYPQSGGIRVDESMTTEGAGEAARILLEAEATLRDSTVATAAAKSISCRRWFILRLAGIYGPGRHHLLDQLKEGAMEVSGRGEHRLNLIHREDIVSAIWASFAAPFAVANEIFNLADDRPASKEELIAWLAAKLGRERPRFTGEARAGARRAVTPDRVISGDKIRQMLGWRPRFTDYRAGYEALLGA